jgi:hypothetical protein
MEVFTIDSSPLLQHIDEELSNTSYIIDNIRCVRYRNIRKKKKSKLKIFRKKKKSEYNLKIEQNADNIIPNEYTYLNKDGKRFLKGDFFMILLCENLKSLITENKRMNQTIDRNRMDIFKLSENIDTLNEKIKNLENVKNLENGQSFIDN